MTLMKSLLVSVLVAGTGCSGNAVVNSEPARVVENESHRDGDEFNFSHYTEALRYIMRYAPQGATMEDTFLPKVYLSDNGTSPDNRRKSDRFSFNLSEANSSIGDVERFIDVYYNEWETTLPEHSGYHGRGDGGWYNIGWGPEGIEFFVRNNGNIFGLTNNKQTSRMEEVESGILEINARLSDYIQVFPLIIEEERGKSIPTDPSDMRIGGYNIHSRWENLINGDIIWIQDTLRDKGLEVTLTHPNCNAVTVDGYDSIEAQKIMSTLSSWNRYWSRIERTPNGLEFKVIPPLDWIPGHSD